MGGRGLGLPWTSTSTLLGKAAASLALCSHRAVAYRQSAASKEECARVGEPTVGNRRARPVAVDRAVADRQRADVLRIPAPSAWLATSESLRGSESSSTPRRERRSSTPGSGRHGRSSPAQTVRVRRMGRTSGSGRCTSSQDPRIRATTIYGVTAPSPPIRTIRTRSSACGRPAENSNHPLTTGRGGTHMTAPHRRRLLHDTQTVASRARS